MLPLATSPPNLTIELTSTDTGRPLRDGRRRNSGQTAIVMATVMATVGQLIDRTHRIDAQCRPSLLTYLVGLRGFEPPTFRPDTCHTEKAHRGIGGATNQNARNNLLLQTEVICPLVPVDPRKSHKYLLRIPHRITAKRHHSCRTQYTPRRDADHTGDTPHQGS